MKNRRTAKKRHKIKKVTLPPAGAVHVPVPKDVVPVIAVDRGAVKIIPVKRRTLLEWLQS